MADHDSITCCDCKRALPATSEYWPPSGLAGVPGVRCKPCGHAYFQKNKDAFAVRRAADAATLRKMSAFEVRRLIHARKRAGKPVSKRLMEALVQSVGRMEREQRLAAALERKRA